MTFYRAVKVEECKSHVLIRTLSYFSNVEKISIQNYTFLESLLYKESTIWRWSQVTY